MTFTSAVTVRHGTYPTKISNTTIITTAASAPHAEALTYCWNRRWMMTRKNSTSGGTTHAQFNTTTQFPKQQDPLDWLVCHCSHDLVVSCPELTRRYGDQSNPAGERAGRTVMDWCRLRLEISNRQNHGGLSCTAHQSHSTLTESHGRWRMIWSRFSSGITVPSWVTKLSSTK